MLIAPVWGSIPGPGKCKVNIICIEPPRGVTLPCQEHWQVLVTQLLWAPLLSSKKTKSQLDAKTQLRYRRDLDC